MPGPDVDSAQGKVAPVPELAILLVTDSWAACRWTLEGYREQGDLQRLELVIVALAGTKLSPDAREVRGFPCVRVVGVESAVSIARAEAEAWPAATAPFIVFAETCARPMPGFADAMISACRSGRWAVVGPAMVNANPTSATSWAAMHINYGPWLDAPRPGAREHVPGHNTAYCRRALVSLGTDVEALLTSLTALHLEIRRRGFQVGLDSSARVEMLNVSLPSWFVVDQFQKGCRFASLRRRRWPLVRRLAYAAGAPLIPLVRLSRVLAGLRQRGRTSDVLRGGRAAMLFTGLVASSAGELVGYLFGERGTWGGFEERALHRPRFVRPEDRPAAYAFPAD